MLFDKFKFCECKRTLVLRRSFLLQTAGASYQLLLPDCSYADKHIDDMYVALSAICQDARHEKCTIVIGGDFDAEPGRDNFGKWDDTLGRHGLEKQNARGEQLTTWAASNGLILGNTHVKKRFGLKYTHTGATGNRR